MAYALFLAPSLLVQLGSLGSGGVLIAEAVVKNFRDTTSVIIILIILLGGIVFIGNKRLK